MSLKGEGVRIFIKDRRISECCFENMAKRYKRAPHSGIDESYWDRLDNAAKLFPSITTARSPNVYRLTAVLFDEVDPAVLQTALEKALEIMPSFALKLHRGLFWYYFDVNNDRPVVKPEQSYPCSPIYRSGERGFLFRVTYYHRRINLEMYHALADGMGAVSFMRTLVYCYFNVMSGGTVPEENIRHEADAYMRDFGEDSFLVNVSDTEIKRKNTEREPDAYRLGGYRYDGTRLGVLSAEIPADSLLALAKSHGATLSEYICALLIWSIYNTSYRSISGKRPIAVSIPVNLRGMFESSTLRNFFGHINVGVVPKRGASFEDILELTKKRFSECLTKGYFERQITEHVNIERIPGVRFVPIWLKNPIMRAVYSRSAKRYTITLSNLGRITLPSVIADRVDRFEVIIGGSQTHVKKVSLCSYKNNLALSFSSTVDDNSIEQFLFSYLSRQGIDITISSNETLPPEKVHRKKPSKAEKRAEKIIKKAEKRAVCRNKRKAKKEKQ